MPAPSGPDVDSKRWRLKSGALWGRDHAPLPNPPHDFNVLILIPCCARRSEAKEGSSVLYSKKMDQIT